MVSIARPCSSVITNASGIRFLPPRMASAKISRAERIAICLASKASLRCAPSTSVSNSRLQQHGSKSDPWRLLISCHGAVTVLARDLFSRSVCPLPDETCQATAIFKLGRCGRKRVRAGLWDKLELRAFPEHSETPQQAAGLKSVWGQSRPFGRRPPASDLPLGAHRKQIGNLETVRAKRARAAGISPAARALRSDVVRRAASRGGTLRCTEARRVAYRDVDKSYASHRLR